MTEQPAGPPASGDGVRADPAAWAVVAQHTGELTSVAARAIAAALEQPAAHDDTRVLGRTPAEVRDSLPSLEPLAQTCVWRLSPTHSDPRVMPRSLNQQSLNRAVDLRLVVDLSASVGPLATAGMDWRERTRVAPVEVQMILIDERHVVLDGPVLVPGQSRSGWLIGDPATVAAACRLWHETVRVSHPLPDSALFLSERQVAIAKALLDGETDAAIARSLRVSVRTVASEVKVLMDAVGARSRYQAGQRLSRI